MTLTRRRVHVDKHGNVTHQRTTTSEPSLDLRRVEIAPITRGGKRTGFSVTITTEGDLRDRTMLTFKTRTKSCPDLWLQYVHGPDEPGPQLRSGCSSGVPLTAKVESRRVTLAVPFSALPMRVRQDEVLQRASVSSQIHVVSEPLGERRVGTPVADTTLQDVRYRMR